MSGEPPSITAARALIETLIAHGMRDVVLCPGSRSAPLAYAAHAAARAGAIRLTVRLDERSAAFVALGIARGSRRAAAVLTTSGTACANLHPAVLEADAAGVPLLVITADRPAELHGVGANQTCDQADLFGTAVRRARTLATPRAPSQGWHAEPWRAEAERALKAAAGSESGRPGPVHLNCQLRDPLAPQGPLDWPAAVAASEASAGADVGERSETMGRAGEAVALARGPMTVVVAGEGAGPAARDLAQSAGWPLFAEPHSSARGGPNAIGCYRPLLARHAALTHSIERVVVFGRPTLSRPITRLTTATARELIVVADGAAPWYDLTGRASLVAPRLVVPGDPTPAETAALARWREADTAAARLVAELCLGSGLTGLRVARAALSATGPDETLLTASSNPIRDLDLLEPALFDRRAVVTNRGLAGIDGTVSTGTGLAIGSGRPVRALVGDLAFLHDATGLLRGSLEDEVPLEVIVANDGGGSIFEGLEYGRPALADGFERLFVTPQRADLCAIAAGLGAVVTRVTAPDELDEALRAPVDRRRVVEAVIDPAARRTHAVALAEGIAALEA